MVQGLSNLCQDAPPMSPMYGLGLGLRVRVRIDIADVADALNSITPISVSVTASRHKLR